MCVANVSTGRTPWSRALIRSIQTQVPATCSIERRQQGERKITFGTRRADTGFISKTHSHLNDSFVPLRALYNYLFLKKITYKLGKYRDDKPSTHKNHQVCIERRKEGNTSYSIIIFCTSLSSGHMKSKIDLFIYSCKTVQLIYKFRSIAKGHKNSSSAQSSFSCQKTPSDTYWMITSPWSSGRAT